VITDSNFQDFIALDGGIFYLLDDFDGTITQSYMTEAKAFQADGTTNNGNGGGIYIERIDPSAVGSLEVSNCDDTIQYFEAWGDGGFIYAQHPTASLTFDECSWNHLEAAGTGGLISGETGTFTHTMVSSNDCALTNITGGIISSTLSGQTFELEDC